MSTLSVATVKSISSAAPAFQNSSGTEKGLLVGAYVNFDGSAGGTNKPINDSFNVSSVTDNASAKFTVNFTNSFANANYTMAGCHNSMSDGVSIVAQDGSNTTNASQFSLITTVYNGGANPSIVRALFIGDI